MLSKGNRYVRALPMMRTRGTCFVAAIYCLLAIAGTCRAEEPAVGADAENAEQSPTELSVAPLEFPSYPDDRPGWIDQAPQLDGAVHQWPVVSVPSLNRERCRESLRQQARFAIAEYARHLLEHDGSGLMGAPLDMKESWVQAALDDAGQTYHGTVGTSDGEMFEEAALLDFDEAFREVLRDEWRSQQVGRRLVGVGLLGGGSVALLVALSTVLRWVGFRRR